MTREANRVEIKVTELFTNNKMLQSFSCVSDQSVAEVNKANQVVFSQTSEDHLLFPEVIKVLHNRTPNCVCAEAMSVRYNVEEALEVIFSHAQQDNSDSEEEVEDVSEEEDGEEYNPEHDESSSEEEENPEAESETFLSKNGKIIWSSAAYDQHGRHAEQNIVKMTPGPTRYAVSHAQDIVSTFYLFITPAIEKIILDMTNLEGFRKYGDSWKKMDEIDLQAYLGLLILAGVYRSRGEAAASLWDAESGRAIFRATMPLKLFHTYSRLIRFDDRESRPARRVTDKLAAIREVWDKWVERLPYLYNPGPNVTVDEQLVPFRGNLFSYL